MAERKGFEEFEIELRSVAGGFEARVLASRFHRAAEPFVPPFDGDGLQRLLIGIESRIRKDATRDIVRRGGAKVPAPLDPSAVGRRLFQALFTGTVERRFREAVAGRERAPASQRGLGLRLRLTFDRAEDFSLLATLPWELLREDPQFLSLHGATPVVRSHNQRTVERSVARRPIRILLVGSSPKDIPILDVAGEMRRVRRTLRKVPDVEVSTLLHPDVRRLRDRLHDGRFHVFHFMGHGQFLDGPPEQLALCFEGDERQSEPVSGSELAEFLKDLPELRLVVLNACWGGALPRRRGQDPFTGVAAALLQRDIPAVVAMQFPISDRAAKAFSEVFYDRLAKGDPVGAAVTEGRLEIFKELPQTVEWATPVLFLSGDDRLFERPRARVRKPAGALEKPVRKGAGAAPLAPARPLHLAVQTFSGAYFSSAEPPDDLLDLTRFFEGRYIRRPTLWDTEVFPRLRDFLLRHAATRRPLVLDFAAHLTLAFAAGYVLEAKSGLDVEVYQRSQRGVTTWHAEAGPAREGPLWIVQPERRLRVQSRAVAFALGVTVPIADHVERYLRRTRAAVGRIVPMTPDPGAGPTSVADGLHALQLAQSLALEIRRRTAVERAAVLHLFAAAPNGLLFFLGQLGKSLGTVQLYEHDFENPDQSRYMPSLRLPISSPRPIP